MTIKYKGIEISNMDNKAELNDVAFKTSSGTNITVRMIIDQAAEEVNAERIKILVTIFFSVAVILGILRFIFG